MKKSYSLEELFDVVLDQARWRAAVGRTALGGRERCIRPRRGDGDDVGQRGGGDREAGTGEHFSCDSMPGTGVCVEDFAGEEG